MTNMTEQLIDLPIGVDFLVEIDGEMTFIQYEGVGGRYREPELAVFRSSRGGFVLLTQEQVDELLADDGEENPDQGFFPLGGA
jgi:hypothetical protein